MSIFSKIFGSSDKRKIKKLLSETEKQVKKEYKPMGEIGMSIIKASTNSLDAVKGLIQASTEKEKQKHEIFIFYEFIYFYMHMIMRHAFAQLTGPQIEKLQSYLGPLISSVAIDSYFAHWPEDLKSKMVSEFYEKLNEAEIEYTQCTHFASSEQEDESQTQKFRALFMNLGSNISSLSGNGKDIAVVMHVVELAISELKKININKLIEETKKVN